MTKYRFFHRLSWVAAVLAVCVALTVVHDALGVPWILRALIGGAVGVAGGMLADHYDLTMSYRIAWLDRLRYRWLTFRHREALARPLVIDEDGYLRNPCVLPGETISIEQHGHDDVLERIVVSITCPDGTTRKHQTWSMT